VSVAEVIFSGTMLAQTVRMAIPYACAATGGVLCERSGVVNIALEGTLLASALAAIATHAATGSATAGLVAGVACGAAIGAVHATLVVRGRVDAIVSGLAINLAAAGGTRFLLRALYGSSSNSPSVAAFRFLPDASALVRAVLDPFFVLGAIAALGSAWLLARTRFGLRLRACGEDPSAAQAVGVRVDVTRTAAVCLGSAVCGLGGTALAYDLHQFQAGMSGGRGFIALAAVIVSGWRPWAAASACLAFAALDALEIVLQGHTHVPAQLFAILPFVATLVALALFSRRRSAHRPPAGLGKHPE
jgi:general nucleoside transport system permease protein